MRCLKGIRQVGCQMPESGALVCWAQADDGRFMRSMRRRPAHLLDMQTRNQVVERSQAQRTSLRQLALLRSVRPVPSRRDQPADLLPLSPRPDLQSCIQAILAAGEQFRSPLPQVDSLSRRSTGNAPNHFRPATVDAGATAIAYIDSEPSRNLLGSSQTLTSTGRPLRAMAWARARVADISSMLRICSPSAPSAPATRS